MWTMHDAPSDRDYQEQFDPRGPEPEEPKDSLMTFAEFDTFMDKLYTECLELRGAKGKEYAHSSSRFANFNRIAREINLPPLTVAYIYYRKHLDAIVSYMETGRTFSEPIRGRFLDLIMYSFLMAGIAEEMEREKEQSVG